MVVHAPRSEIRVGDWVSVSDEDGTFFDGQAASNVSLLGTEMLTIFVTQDQSVTINVNLFDVSLLKRDIVLYKVAHEGSIQY